MLSAEILIWQGNYKEPLAILSALPAALPPEQLAKRKSLESIANTYLQQFDQAEKLAAEAEQIATTQAPNMLPDAYLSRGILDVKEGHIREAEQDYVQLLHLARQQHRQFLTLAALGNLGISNVRAQHYDRAIDLFSEVRDIGEKSHNKLQIEKATFNLAWCYRSLGNYEKAMELYLQAESVAHEIGLEKDRLNALDAIGLTHLELHDWAGAEPYMQQALALAQSSGNKSFSAMILNNLSRVAIERGDLAQATQYNRAAIDLEQQAHDRLWLDEAQQLNARIQIVSGHTAEGEAALRALIRTPTDENDLHWGSQVILADLYAKQHRDREAESLYRSALSQLDAARAMLKSDDLRVSFLTTANDFYDSYVGFIITHGRIREALAVAEHSRARTLAEGLGVPTPTPAAFHPEQAARRVQGVVLSYWLCAGHSYLWVVTPTTMRAFPIASEKEIRTAVTAYNKALLGPSTMAPQAEQMAQNLYSMLVAPAQRYIPPHTRVAIVADECLHSLNFETLMPATPSPHYWIEDVLITEAPSLQMLTASQPVRKTSSARMLLVGNPLPAASEFPALTFGNQEISAVQKHFAPAQLSVLTGAGANTRAYLTSDTGAYSYIHFVTHGTASRVAPMESSIVLSPDGDDYKLYARQIATRPLRADLVTVSACYGAGSSAYTGEGLVGLSWAFLRAGAHTVIAALWEVNDSSTPQFMDSLYAHLQQGNDPAASLRLAKLEMLHSSGIHRRPFYWGSFQCYIGR